MINKQNLILIDRCSHKHTLSSPVDNNINHSVCVIQNKGKKHYIQTAVTRRMSLDFDRYLLNTDLDLESMDIGIHKAYAQWNSYGYLAYSMCSGSVSGSIPAPLIGSPAQVTVAGDLGHNQHDSGCPNNTYHEHCVGRAAALKQNRFESRQYNHTSDVDCAARIQNEKTNTSSQLSNKSQHLCHRDNNSNMPRPPGYEFGSRLGHRPCARTRKLGQENLPALGVNGLMYNTSSHNTFSNRRDLETFPRSITNKRFAKTTLSTNQRNITLNAKPSLEENERPTLRIERPKTYEASFDCHQHPKALQKNCVLSPVPTPKPRKVSFADEHGGTLVRCHVFEKQAHVELSLSVIGEDSDADCDVIDPERCEEGRPTEGGTDISKPSTRMPRDSINIIPDHTSNDIAMVKHLITEHREYLENLKSSVSDDHNGNVTYVTPVASVDNGNTSQDNDTRVTNTTISTFSKSTSTLNTIPSSVTEQNNTSDSVHIQKLHQDTSTQSVSSRLVLENVASEDATLSRTLCLDKVDLKMESSVIKGKIHLTDLCYNKHVFVRYTTNQWDSFQDISATYESRDYCSCAHSITETDCDVVTFGFVLDIGHVLEINSESSRECHVEFAMCYRAKDIGEEFWDNNFGSNYRLSVLK